MLVLWPGTLNRWLRSSFALLVMVFVALFASGIPVAAQSPPDLAPSRGQSVTLKGQLSVIWGDPLTGGEHQMAFVLFDEQGTSTDLVIDEALLVPLGGADGVAQKQVEVVGDATDGTQIKVRSITPVGEQTDGIAAGQANPNAAAVGSKPYVTILCRFADSPADTPKPSDFYEGMMGNTRPGIDHYWREVSYNNIDLEGSQVFGWYTLPQPLSYYYTQDPPDFQRLANDCTALADAAVSFPTFSGINLAFNKNFGCCAWGGSIYLTLDGVTKYWPATWMPPGGSSQTIWAHETGHAFGLVHSANTLGATYQNGWDVLSQSYYNCVAASDPVYGCIGQGTIAANKDQLGWIAPANKLTASLIGAYSIILSPLGEPPVSGQHLMAQIPIPGGATFYTVEARRRVGYDSKLAGDAVIIHAVNKSRLDHAWVVDSDGNNNSNDEGAMWRVGEAFTDATNGITVVVTGATSTSYNVTVTRTSGACLDDAAPADYEPDNTRAEARAINLDTTERHSFCAVDDQDWVKFTGLARGSYRIETQNVLNPTDTIVELYAPDGTTLITSDDNGGGSPNSLIVFNPQTSGTYFLKVRQKDGILANAYDLTITATPPPPLARVDGVGSPQSATVATGFAAPLVVTVRDTLNNLVADATVSFSAPSSGASATLSAASATTDANGQASITANAGQIAGSYDVTATVEGANGPLAVSFRLTNTPGAPVTLTASGQGQAALTSTIFAQSLQVTARDAYNNPVPQATINFSAPSSGASAALSAASAATDANGQASITARAGQIAGSYDVTATFASTGGPLAVSFRLTNTAPPPTVYRVYLPTLHR